MAGFLFVHGAFQGGWVWKDTAAELEKLGRETHRPTLTGCGYMQRGGDNGAGLPTYIDDVCAYLAFEDLQDVTLVAHSYSGMVCGAVAAREADRISRLVFVDAVIPEQGLSFADMGGEMFGQMLAKNRGKNGMINPWPLPVFGAPEDKAEWFGKRLRPFPEHAFTTPFPESFDPAAKAANFIACVKTQNPLIRKMADKAKDLGWPVATLDSAHSPMTTHPVELAKLLNEASSWGAA